MGTFTFYFRFGIPPLSSNEKIVFASMFHSMCAIASLQINKNIKDGTKLRQAGPVEVLETDSFRLHCFQTLTGLKIMLISDLSSQGPKKETVLRRIYDLYTDYALKNPFYSLDMPIRYLLHLAVTLLISSSTRHLITEEKKQI